MKATTLRPFELFLATIVCVAVLTLSVAPAFIAHPASVAPVASRGEISGIEWRQPTEWRHV